MLPSRLAQAREIVARYLTPTRMIRARSLEGPAGAGVFLKLETEMPTGSFKVRGAIYSLSLQQQRGGPREVVASSTGNHGAAVAYAAQLLGWNARIFLPENSNPVKRRNIAVLGAQIVEKGAPDLAAAFAAADRYAQESGAFFLNDATDPDLPAGPGTIACEILEQAPDVEQMFVPMGDTALIRGVAAAAKQLSPGLRMIGVQSERAPSYQLSWQAGRAVPTDSCDTIADGLATRTPVPGNVKAICELVDEVMLVSEEEMLSAIGRLALEEHVVAEPAGAAATAAFLKQGNGAGKNSAVLVTGANISAQVLGRAISAYAGSG